jgi:muramidase (phage lysozyme)
MRRLIDLVYRAENGGRIDYNVVYGGIPASARPPQPITTMTVGEVLAYQRSISGRYGSTAMGALQIMPGTLRDMLNAGVVSPDDTFNAATQDKLTLALMDRRGLSDFRAGRMSEDAFINNLAKEWASLPVAEDTYRDGTFIPRGTAYYAGVGPNRSKAAVPVRAVSDAIRNPHAGQGAIPINFSWKNHGATDEMTMGFDGQFTGALVNMITQAPEHIRSQIKLNSGFRSPEHQARIISNHFEKYGFTAADRAQWDADVAEMGAVAAGRHWEPRINQTDMRKWIALPGSSNHQKGMAADLAFESEEAKAWVHENAGHYGLAFPMSWEPWHIELATARGRTDGNVASGFQDAPPVGQNPAIGAPGYWQADQAPPEPVVQDAYIRPWTAPEPFDVAGAGPGERLEDPIIETMLDEGVWRRGSSYEPTSFDGAGPASPGWGQAFADEFTDSFIVREMRHQTMMAGQEFDPAFNWVEQTRQDGLQGHWDYFSEARNKQHYDELVQSFQLEVQRNKRREAWNGTAAQTLGGILSPDSLLTMVLPGSVAVTAARTTGLTGLKAGAATAGLAAGMEVPLEVGRAGRDPFSTTSESIMRIGAGTLAAGVFGGIIGTAAARRAAPDLLRRFEQDIAATMGVGARTETLPLGGGVTGRVRAATPEEASGRIWQRATAARGVHVDGENVIVNPSILMRRFAKGDMPAGVNTPDELMEFEIARAANLNRQAAGEAENLRKRTGSTAGAKQVEGFVKFDEKGNPSVNMGKLYEASQRGQDIVVGADPASVLARTVYPIALDSRKLAAAMSIEDTADMLVDMAKMAGRSRDAIEFREAAEAYFQRKGLSLEALEPQAIVSGRKAAERLAEKEAAEALENWRLENNRVLTNRVSQALSRMTDGPFKRAHRNSLSGHVRDIVDKLAADGAYLTQAMRAGLTRGPSVYSSVRTWDGVIRRLWDAEGELYAKYAGIDLKEFADIRNADLQMNGELMSKTEFRERATRAHITGEADEIPEVNQMAGVYAGAMDEFREAGMRFNILSSEPNGQRQLKDLDVRKEMAIGRRIKAEADQPYRQKNADRLREKIRSMSSGKIPEDQIKPLRDDLELTEAAMKDAETEIAAAVDEIAEIEEMIEGVQRQIDHADHEPDADYFTRIWHKGDIQRNREHFKERVVKPWMRQQPFVEVWEAGQDEIAEQIRHLRDLGVKKTDTRIVKLESRLSSAPKKSRWKTVRAQTDEISIDKRAEEMIEDILGEAEPDDLGRLRQPHRPTFGRRRQFNIPNRYLLKQGKDGNGVADYISTNYLVVAKAYADRMAPAIEMTRAFGRVADGINWEDGLDMEMRVARRKEQEAWESAGNDPAKFAKHWAPLERDILHLRDQVTNRIVTNPERWDNRAATALKSWSHLAFMGGSAIPVVQEIGMLVMRHGYDRLFRNAMGTLDETMRASMGQSVKEMQKSGAMLEIALGGSMASFAETGIEAVGTTPAERWLRTMSNRYFLWNGLSPMTAGMKRLDATLRVSDMARRIQDVKMLGKGASEADLGELARYGISREDAIRMAEEPMFLDDAGNWQPNTEAWGDEDLVRKFRSAIRQGNENTILMATAADKPAWIDGMLYIKKNPLVNRYAANLGLEERGEYWKVQSGIMSLPFTFWNYATAAANKILLSAVDEPSKKALSGMATMVGLGYMVAYSRTDRWDDMDPMDRLWRAVDQSGVMGMIPQYMHMVQTASIGAGMGNPLPVAPRNGYVPSTGDAMINLMGAGPSVASNAIVGPLTGDVDRMSWALPFRNHLLLEDFFDRAVTGYENRRDRNPSISEAVDLAREKAQEWN